MAMISIIILNWNGKHHLDECLLSISAQTYPDYEIILVDNASTDGSQQYITSNFPSVNENNSGFSHGNNIGIKASKGEYIILLNNDTVVDSDFIKSLYTAITSDSSIGFCASKMISYYNKNSIDTAGDGLSTCGAAFKRGHMESPLKYATDDYVFGACAGAAIYRREMLEKIGLLGEDFFLLYEDADFKLQSLAFGLQM